MSNDNGIGHNHHNDEDMNEAGDIPEIELIIKVSK